MSSSSSDESLHEQPAPEGLKGFSKAFATILSRQKKEKGDEILAERAELHQLEEKQKSEEKLKKQLRETRKAKKSEDGHTKVDVLRKDYEKSLRKVANRGIVKIFNAVREFKEGKISEQKSKVDKMPMNNFMELLKGNH